LNAMARNPCPLVYEHTETPEAALRSLKKDGDTSARDLTPDLGCRSLNITCDSPISTQCVKCRYIFRMPMISLPNAGLRRSQSPTLQAFPWRNGCVLQPRPIFAWISENAPADLSNKELEPIKVSFFLFYFPLKELLVDYMYEL
jgi:hypothetical protein